jgi:hypothetical protein
LVDGEIYADLAVAVLTADPIGLLLTLEGGVEVLALGVGVLSLVLAGNPTLLLTALNGDELVAAWNAAGLLLGGDPGYALVTILDGFDGAIFYEGSEILLGLLGYEDTDAKDTAGHGLIVDDAINNIVGAVIAAALGLLTSGLGQDTNTEEEPASALAANVDVADTLESSGPAALASLRDVVQGVGDAIQDVVATSPLSQLVTVPQDEPEQDADQQDSLESEAETADLTTETTDDGGTPADEAREAITTDTPDDGTQSDEVTSDDTVDADGTPTDETTPETAETNAPRINVWRGSLRPGASDDGDSPGGPLATAVRSTHQQLSDAVSGAVDQLGDAARQVGEVTKAFTGGGHSDADRSGEAGSADGGASGGGEGSGGDASGDGSAAG